MTRLSEIFKIYIIWLIINLRIKYSSIIQINIIIIIIAYNNGQITIIITKIIFLRLFF